jgi:ABC-type Mn2+/Zn2+ transport system permease subunit
MEFLTDPWQWWVQPFIGDPILQRAVLAGLLTVLVTSVVGTWVVLRGTTYLGEALGHGILPGVAGAYLLGGNPTAGALIAAAAMAFGVRGIQRRSPLPGESAIGLLLVGMIALTVVLVAAADGIDEHDLHEVLVGVAVLVALVFHRALLVLTFDEIQARLMGMRPRLTELAFLLLVALSVTASFNAVGSLLVFAFLVAPPAAAAMLVRRVPAMMATAALIGTGSVLLGALLAHHLLGTAGHLHGESPIGAGHTSPEEVAMPATMALVAVAVVLLVMVVRGVRSEQEA